MPHFYTKVSCNNIERKKELGKIRSTINILLTIALFGFDRYTTVGKKKIPRNNKKNISVKFLKAVSSKFRHT